jgi:hypothetical protein
MSNGKMPTDKIMSTTAISASNQSNIQAVISAAKGSHRHGGGGGHRESFGGGEEQGVTVLASLLQALTQAASGSAAASQSTTALQSFLTNFLQDLQNNGANSLSPLGSSINTTA